MRELHQCTIVSVAMAFSLLADGVSAQSDELYFVDTRYYADIYHVGTPCNDPDKGYELVVDTMLPEAVNERYVHGALRFPIMEMQNWTFNDHCRATRGSPATATFRADGEPFAEARFVINGTFFDDVHLRIGEVPENDPVADRIYETVRQGNSEDGYDTDKVIDQLTVMLDEVPASYVDDIYYMMASVLRNKAPERAAEMQNGERRDLALLREAAELGHEGAANMIYDISGLDHHFHAYQSSASLMSPDDAATQRLLAKYGFIFDNVHKRRNGSLISQLKMLERKGFSMTNERIFEDYNLPPSGAMIEAELNSHLGRVMGQADNALSALYGLPSDLVYECDGTWCNILGGIGGRARMNVIGIPECDEVVEGETTCTFALALNFDTGRSTNPYASDRVASFALGQLDSATNQREKAKTVTATMVRDGSKWAIRELAE